MKKDDPDIKEHDECWNNPEDAKKMRDKALKASKSLQKANSYVEIFTSYFTSIASIIYFSTSFADIEEYSPGLPEFIERELKA